jgi:predicted Zn-dependent peptidase
LTETFHSQTLENGVVLLAQHMPQVKSAAVSILVPGGSSGDPENMSGSASASTEWLMRGAGDRNTRQLDEALDNLGAQHRLNAHREFLHLSSAQLGRNLPEVLAILVDILRRPRLADDTFAASRDLALQELDGIEDEPSRKAGVLLREQFYPPPLGRCVYGARDDLAAMTADKLRDHVLAGLAPKGTILAFAGNIDWPALVDTTGRLLDDWDAPAPRRVRPGKAPRGQVHLEKDSAQTHICLAHEAPLLTDEMYYPARMAQTVLSGGMSSRLFTEVREKRGLVYHVECSYHAVHCAAGMFTYAGTRPELAQQTTDVTVEQLRALAGGVGEDEIARARVQTNSALVMQGESTSARAATLASDWYYLGKMRSLEEITAAFDAVTDRDIRQCLETYPARDFTRVVVGPEDVQTPEVTQ